MHKVVFGFGTKSTGAPNGLLLLVIRPFLSKKSTCSQISSISFGLYQNLGRFTGLVPSSSGIINETPRSGGSPIGNASGKMSTNSFKSASSFSGWTIPASLNAVRDCMVCPPVCLKMGCNSGNGVSPLGRLPTWQTKTRWRRDPHW